MNRDEYQIRAPFKATYGFHKAKTRPVARYYVYNVDGERKQRMKSFSRQFEYQSPESIAEFDHWFEKMDVFNNPFVGNPNITYSVKEIADRWHDFHAQFFGGNRQDESFHRMVVRLLEDHFNLPANDYRSSMLLALRDQPAPRARLRPLPNPCQEHATPQTPDTSTSTLPDDQGSPQNALKRIARHSVQSAFSAL